MSEHSEHDKQAPLVAVPEGCHHSRNPEECEDCWRDADNAAEIRDLIARADDALVQALTATGKARRAIEDLMSNRVYDIELADAVAELNRAGLSLRHAHRILAARKRLDEEG